MITSERGTLSDAAAGEEVIAPEPVAVCEILSFLNFNTVGKKSR